MSSQQEDCIQSLEQLENDYWNNRYEEWHNSGAYFSSSTKPMERRKYQAWVKRVGKEAKEKNDKSLMVLAYKVISKYEIYPDPLVNTADHF